HEDRYPTCVVFIKAMEAAVFPPPTPKYWRRVALALLLIMLSVGVLGAWCWPFVRESVRSWLGLSSGSAIVDRCGDIVTVAPTVPNGFEPKPDSVDEIVEVGTQRYYARIQPIGKPIVFALVPETQTSALRTFYTMQHKVSNAQFA